VGSQLILAGGYGQPLVLVWQALVVGGLLIYVRYLLHAALMDEASNFGLAETICPSCHQRVLAMGFCPSCGMALTAVSDSVRHARKPVSETVVESAP
ncbi:MAG: hypothetical protein ACXWZ2_09335, partial [Mycobacterium sp.]